MSDISNDDSSRDQETGRDGSREKTMKVTDRRMFTPDGELREEYRHIESASTTGAPASRPPDPPAREPAPPPRGPVSPPAEDRTPEPDPDAPGFMDLVTLLAENASVYLREASTPGAVEPLQHLEVAKLHIDLLGVLKDKTQGNLSSQEQAVLDDVLYRLRLAFSSQRGF